MSRVRRAFPRKPHAERFPARVTGFSPDGLAIAAPESPRAKPVFIEALAVPGDRVELEVAHEARAATFAHVRRVLEPAPRRVEPRCPIVARCGGCPWQAVEYAAQLAWKREALARDAAARPALRGVAISPLAPVPQPYGFRTKIQMAVGGRPGTLAVGFFRPHGREIVDAPECAVQHPEGNRIVREARAILDRERLPPYDERRHDGVLRHILLRIDKSGERAALTLVVRTARFFRRAEIARALAAIRGVTGVYLNVQPARGNVVLGRETVRLAGRSRLLVEVAGMPFLLSPTAFFQTSAAATEVLVARVRERLPGPWASILDLYCGAGLFARALADRARRVVGVEENRAAIEDAEAGLRFAASSGRAPEAAIEFVAATAEGFLAREGRRFEATVVDPPRAGLGPGVIEALARRVAPRRLVYVSCNPETLLRDLDRFAALGYRTLSIDPIDMFPHTPHLECVATLEPAPRASPSASAGSGSSTGEHRASRPS
jgi:23S rRNA (uracil1939-C5)-methyltransferase